MQGDLEPLRAVLHRALLRYLTVTPRGLVLADGEPPLSVVQARILNFGGARTLYRRRKPVCRSLDGVAAVHGSDKRCVDCADYDTCTPQVRVDLIVRRCAYRCLLAFTSARNFLEYDARLRRDGVDLHDAMHEIRVVDRGSWGEIRFQLADAR